MTTSVGRVGVAGATLGWQLKKLVSFWTTAGFRRGRQSALPLVLVWFGLVASRLVFGFGFVFSFLNAIF